MSDGGGTGALDRQTLRLLQRRALEHDPVEEAALVPDPHASRRLELALATDRCPDDVSAGRIDIRWFERDDFGFHYVEQRVERPERWECRWDRHENPHAGRTHFHEPPTADSVRDIDLDTHPLSVLFTVLAAVEERVAELWER